MTIDNPWALAAAVCVLLFGGAGGGWLISYRKDRRVEKREEIDITALVREVAADTIKDLKADVADLRGRVGTLERELDRAYVVIRAAVSFAHTLLAYIALHLPDRTDVPDIPPILTDYISERAIPFASGHAGRIDTEADPA